MASVHYGQLPCRHLLVPLHVSQFRGKFAVPHLLAVYEARGFHTLNLDAATTIYRRRTHLASPTLRKGFRKDVIMSGYPPPGVPCPDLRSLPSRSSFAKVEDNIGLNF